MSSPVSLLSALLVHYFTEGIESVPRLGGRVRAELCLTVCSRALCDVNLIFFPYIHPTVR